MEMCEKCRVCRNEITLGKSAVPIFNLAGTNLDVTIAVLLEKYLHIRIDDGDSLPNVICEDCFSLLICCENGKDYNKTKQKCLTDRFTASHTCQVKVEPPENVTNEDHFHLQQQCSNDNYSSNYYYTVVEKTTLYCCLCTSILYDQKGYTDHMEKIHKLLHPQKPRKKLTCNICQTKFENLGELKAHRHAIQKCFQCIYCEHTSSSEDYALQHFDQEHSIKIEANEFTSCSNIKIESSEAYNATSVTPQGTVKVGQKSRKERVSKRKKFKCSYCVKSFSLSYLRKQHETTHDAENSKKHYKCSYCSRRFSEFSVQIRHERLHKRPLRWFNYKCSYCNTEFTRHFDLKIHEMQHARKVLQRCAKQRTGGRSSTYKWVHTAAEPIKPYKCSACDKSFAYEYILRYHELCHSLRRIKKHPDHLIDSKLYAAQGSYKCSYCEKSFSTTAQVKCHEKIHAKTNVLKLYKCNYCEKSFTRDRYLKDHEVTHTGAERSKPHKCSVCGKKFPQASALKRHRRMHTGEYPPKRFKCSFCDKRYIYPSAVKRHELVHTGETRDNYKCSHCGRGFEFKSTWVTHERTHTKEPPPRLLPCSYCDKSFASQSLIKRHERIHTGEEPPKPFKCSYCDKHFRHQSVVRTHERIHTGELPPHQCLDCGKRYAEPNRLKAHQSKHHGLDTPLKPLKCSMCENRFGTPQGLKVHEKIHMVPRDQYKCQYCEKCCTTRSNLKRHELMHVGKSVPKRHKCSYCEKCFTVPSRRRQHEKTHNSSLKPKISVKREFFSD